MIFEMVTLASCGDLPALPLGQSYPRKRGWLLGRPVKSKVLKFRPLSKKRESLQLAVVPNIRLIRGS